MGQLTKIEWCHRSANLWWGCTHAGLGCDNCYAETLSKRWGNDVWGNDKPRKEIRSFWNDLDKYQKLALESGEKHTVFVGSMMDIFEKPMPLINSKGEEVSYTTEDIRNTFFMRIMGDRYPNLIFLLLTKRPSNINKYIPESWKQNPPSNVWFGTSPVNQETADKLIPQLLKVKGNLFLSVEPMLDYMDIYPYLIGGTIVMKQGNFQHPVSGNNVSRHVPVHVGCENEISWAICGGESGHHRRPFNLEWARSLRDQCADADVPFFFKQIDKVRDKSEGIPADLQIRQLPKF